MPDSSPSDDPSKRLPTLGQGCSPKPLSGKELKRLDAVRVLVAIARHLNAEAAPTDARAILDLAARYRPQVSHALDVWSVAGHSPDQLRDMAVRSAAPVLLDHLLPAARDYLIHCLRDVAGHTLRAAGPQEEARTGEALCDRPSGATTSDATVPMSEVAAALFAGVRALNGAGHPHIDVVSDAAADEAKSLASDVLGSGAAEEKPIPVEVLSQALLRLEAINGTLTAMRVSPARIREVAFYARLVSRTALRQGALTLAASVPDGPDDDLERSVAIIASVDSMITFAMRLLDAAGDEAEDPQTPFVKRIDEVTLDGFSDVLVRLGVAVMVLVEKLVDKVEYGDDLFVTLTRQVTWLHRFCSWMGRREPPPALAELADFLVLHSAGVCRRVTALVTNTACDARLRSETAGSLLVRAEAVEAMLADMNRRHLRDDLGLAMQALRQRVG